MKALQFLWNARTTAFGYFQVIIGVLAATDGVFTPRGLKFVILGNGLLTACLGHFNNLRIRQAAATQLPQ